MKNSIRRVSMLLAVMMVLSLFAAYPMMASAADTNYASGLTPIAVTKGGTDYDATTQGALTIMTDGAEVTAYGETVKLLGGGATYAFTYDLGSVKTDVAGVYLSLFYNAGTGGSYGSIDAATVSVSSDNSTYTDVYTNTTGYTLADETTGVKSFAFNFTATSAQYVKVSFVSNKYLTGISELGIYNYAATGTSTAIETVAPPTLVDGNYAYGATYTVTKTVDGTEADPTYRNENQNDATSNWLTDGYEGDGSSVGTNFKTVSVTGTTGKTNVYTYTLTLPAAKSDVAYVTLYNVPIAGTSFGLPTAVAVSTSTDGLTYTAASVTEVQTLNADGTSYEFSYVFGAAVSAQYVQVSITFTSYMLGLDEIWVGGSATVPEIPEESSVDSSSISASEDVITSTTATNYAPNGYYQYGANASYFPWDNATYADDTHGATAAGVYGKGQLNDGTYATGNYTDTAWVGILGSATYDNVKQIEIIFDLAAVYGDIDQIVINSMVHGGSEDYGIVNNIKVSFGDYSGTYGAETTRWAGDVTETTYTGYVTYKAQFAVGDLTGNVRFVKIVIPKTVYRYYMDEIEIIGKSDYTNIGVEPSSSEDPSSEDPSSEDPSSNVSSTIYYEQVWSFDVSAEVGNFDPDGADLSEFVEDEYIKVVITYDWADTAKIPYGLASFEGRVCFDEANLVPAFVTGTHLNGVQGSADPLPVSGWPTYTTSTTIPGVGTFELTYKAVKGLCKAYAVILEDGTLAGPADLPDGHANKNDKMSYGEGFIYLTYSIDTKNCAKEGLLPEDNISFTYYFSAKDGAFSAGESFTFSVDDRQLSSYAGDCYLYGAAYQGADATVSHQNAYGKGDSFTLTIPEETVYYNVTFVDKDGNTIEEQTVEAGTAATAPEAPAVEGWTFTGWDADFTAVSSDLTVTAQYEQIMVNITFVAGNGGTLTGTTSVQVAYGTDLSTVTYPTPVANDGYEFSAWDVTSGIVTVDTTITASFSEVVVAAEHFTFAEGADNTYVTVDATKGLLIFKAGVKTASAIKALFIDTDLAIATATGTAVADTAKATTGRTITSTINGVSKTLTIIVYGDVTGDGNINGLDYARALNHAKKTTTLTGNQLLAANVMQPNLAVVNGLDYAKILNYAKGSLSNF